MGYRVQFDISDDEYKRFEIHGEAKKYLSHYGKKSFLEWLTRMDRRKERAISQDEETIRRIVREEMMK